MTEQERQAALKQADKDYYNRQSPHYRDNIRFSWAVKTINERFEQSKKTDGSTK